MIGLGLFTVIKIMTSILVVVVLSLIAEQIGPRFAGIVAGYPLGAAISLFFIGLEIDSGFASRSAIFTAAGLSASVAFVGGYLIGLHLSKDRGRLVALTLSVLPALVAYALAALLISAIPISRISATAIATLSIVTADRLFRTIPDVLIAQKIRLSFSVTLLRVERRKLRMPA